MALINCPECSQQISESAKKCPHCGYKIKKSKRKVIIIVTCVIVSMTLISIVGYGCFIIPDEKYNNAMSLLNNHQTDNAKQAFKTLENYKNSQEMITECDYQKAIIYLNDGDYKHSTALLRTIKSYKDTSQLLEQIKNENGLLVCTKQIINMLKDPHSAKFYEIRTSTNNGGNYTLIKYSAKNSYGANSISVAGFKFDSYIMELNDENATDYVEKQNLQTAWNNGNVITVNLDRLLKASDQ